MTSAPSHTLRRSISRMSPRTSSTGASARLAGLAPPPNRKPSSATTRAPRSAKVWHRLEPRNPAPPVTSTLRPCQFMISLLPRTAVILSEAKQSQARYALGTRLLRRSAPRNDSGPLARIMRWPPVAAGAAHELAEAEQQHQYAGH